MKNAIKNYLYYMLIGLISFIAVAFLPLLNSEVDIGFDFPKTPAAMLLWATSRIAVSLLNVLIFHCFVKQGDINTKDDENRIEAEKMLSIVEKAEQLRPRSPKEFFVKEYGKKVPTLLLSTALSLIAFGPAILTFDLVTFLSYLFTVCTSVIFGVIEKFKVEDYYRIELLKYAMFEIEKIREKELEEKKSNAELQRKEIP